MKKWMIALVAVLAVIGTVAIYEGRTVESKIEGFPVPKMAKYVEDDNKADYQYRSSRFEYGLSPFYKLAIRLEGWKETSNEGHMRTYEKDGRKVILLKYPGEDSIYIF
ncbi:hypothetical protein [Bacillus manliponensis]|uniref:hypothetical protein n=1 Tax=Bacillus manliponensis TaxID=574376 RepID=UPI003517249B